MPRPNVRTFALLAAAGLIPALAGPQAASAKGQTLTAVLSVPSVSAGSTVTLSGSLRPIAHRTVRLELRKGKAWTVVRSTTSSKTTGKYRFTLPTTTAGTFVYRANAAKRHATRPVSPARTLTVTAPVTPPCCKTNPTLTPPPLTTPTIKPGVTPTPAPATKSAFRAVYALASDQTAAAGKAAAITNDIGAINGWFATQTIGNVQPRWVRDGTGAVPITTITLTRPAAAYATATFASVVAEISAVSPTPANQKTVVWLDAGSPDGCAVTGSGDSIVFEAQCNIHPATGDIWPYGATYVTAHEITHNFGAVNSCAPHQGNGGHVLDDPRDVLYAGGSARDWTHQMLDPGHDDYYATGRSDCPGIETSPFWTATSDPSS